MKTRNRFLIIFIMVFSILFSPLIIYATNYEGQKINHLTNGEREEIEKLIEENMSKGNIPGLSVNIVKEDKIVYQRGFGYSDIDEKSPITSQSLFELASNSKAFTALGILSLEKSGQIDINDEVTKYIPWLKVKYKGEETPLTIEQILHQTSGISSGTIDNIPISNEDSALEETVRTLIDLELDSEPGQTFQYATINYDILGLIIEKVSGESYENYMYEYILKPLELNNTFLFRDENINRTMTSGYKTGFLKPRLYEAPTYRGNKPAGYIISSGEDMGKWLKIQMGTMDQLKFDKEIIKNSHKATKTFDYIGNEVLYGGGWFLQGEKQIFHSGMNPNYSSYIVCNNKGADKEKIGVAILSNLSTNYVINIGLGINGILHGESFEENIPDSNQILDKVGIGLIFVLSILNLNILFRIIKLVREVNKKQRKYEKKGIVSRVKLFISFLLMLGLSYLIYLMPMVLLNGMSWKTSFVWSPNSIKIALYSLYIGIWLIYFYFILKNLFKDLKKIYKRSNSTYRMKVGTIVPFIDLLVETVKLLNYNVYVKL